ncbi:protein of unknown function [Hyphomicrobium sp. 1Nfss2.1]
MGAQQTIRQIGNPTFQNLYGTFAVSGRRTIASGSGFTVGLLVFVSHDLSAGGLGGLKGIACRISGLRSKNQVNRRLTSFAV